MYCSVKFQMYEKATLQNYTCITCNTKIHPQDLAITHYDIKRGIRCLECPPFEQTTAQQLDDYSFVAS